MSPPGVDLDELAALEEQRDFLLRSLDDLDREHEVGDLDEHDYQTLHDDYTVRTAEVLRAIAEHRSALHDDLPPRSWAKIAAWVGGVVVLAVVGGWSVAHYSGSRATAGPAQAPVTKCITLTQQLISGTDSSGSDPLAAVKCYRTVLAADKTNKTAYAYQGWTWALLARQLGSSAPKDVVAGFVKQASTSLDSALKLDPKYPDALVFSSINALWQADPAGAKAYLARFDALGLPPGNQMAQLVNQMLRPQLDPQPTTSTPPTSTP